MAINDPSLKSVDIVALLRQLETLTRNKVPEQVRLNLVLGASEMSISTDGTLLRHVLESFLDNACKFTDKGSITFGFDVNGDELYFFVKDTGIGLTGNESEDVFDGPTMGLPQSKSIIEGMGGEIGAESRGSGKGSTFWCTLPMGDSESTSQPASGAPDHGWRAQQDGSDHQPSHIHQPHSQGEQSQEPPLHPQQPQQQPQQPQQGQQGQWGQPQQGQWTQPQQGQQGQWNQPQQGQWGQPQQGQQGQWGQPQQGQWGQPQQGQWGQPQQGQQGQWEQPQQGQQGQWGQPQQGQQGQWGQPQQGQQGQWGQPQQGQWGQPQHGQWGQPQQGQWGQSQQGQQGQWGQPQQGQWGQPQQGQQGQWGQPQQGQWGQPQQGQWGQPQQGEQQWQQQQGGWNQSQPQQPQGQPQQPQGQPHGGAKRTILIAEDNESNYILFESILEGQFDLIHALNGQEAVDYARQSNPDLILMDINMPIMDGYEAVKNIRMFNGTVPIIAVTAYAFVTDKQRIFDNGFNGYVSKPISIQRLQRLIATHLGE